MGAAAVRAVRNACKGKFPTIYNTKSKCIELLILTPEEIKKITLKYQTNSSAFEVYNGNDFDVRNINVEFEIKGREHVVVKNFLLTPKKMTFSVL